MNILETYIENYHDFLRDIAINLEKYLSEILVEHSHIDRISARAKDPDRFAAKAVKPDANGGLKYQHPMQEIQDQIGARITVFYLADIDSIRNVILKYMTPIEIQKKEPENSWEFGYFGTHLILRLPDDIVPDIENSDIPEFFELQIKTLFQHAWSEAYHDLGYKSDRELNQEERRKLALTAAQAWGADQIFREFASFVDPTKAARQSN